MPLYDYVCGNCGVRTEVMHGVHAPGPEACPSCGSGPMKKALNAPAIHFKGTGWAKKERASSSGTKAAPRSAEPGSGGDSGGEGSGASNADSAPTSGSGGADVPAPAPARGGAGSDASSSSGLSSAGSSSAGSSSAGSSSTRSGTGEG